MALGRCRLALQRSIVSAASRYRSSSTPAHKPLDALREGRDLGVRHPASSDSLSMRVFVASILLPIIPGNIVTATSWINSQPDFGENRQH